MNQNNYDEYLSKHPNELYDPFKMCLDNESMLEQIDFNLFGNNANALERKLPPKSKISNVLPTTILPKSGSVFGDDDDDEFGDSTSNPQIKNSSNIDTVPKEAKLRMRNMGKETAKSTGPNSFYNIRDSGFVGKKLWQKNLEEISKNMDD